MLVAYGAMVGPALDAAALLEKEGVSAGVINARFAKPLDTEAIVTWAQRTRAIPGGGTAAAVAASRRMVEPGHRVTIKSSKDIWYEIEWKEQIAYIKKEDVTRL
jgi:transketolase C-terminal domain/subunit